MVNNKKTKILVSILMILIMVITIGSTMVRAEDDIFTTKLSRQRYVKNNNTYEPAGAYALNTTPLAHPIYQIVHYKNSTSVKPYFCLNASVGNSWTNLEGGSINNPVTYDKSYDLVNENNATGIKSLISEYQNMVSNDNAYKKLMWVLDNMYIEGGEISVEQLLEKAGIVHGEINDSEHTISYYYDKSKNPKESSIFKTDNPIAAKLYGRPDMGYYYYDTSDVKHDVLMSSDLVESVEQAVIWYFTNCEAKTESEFNFYEDGSHGDGIRSWLKRATDPEDSPASWPTLSTITTEGEDSTGETPANTGAMLQEQASILYNYLIDGAEAAVAAGYDGTTAPGTIDIEYMGTGNLEVSNLAGDNNKYILGPLKITTTGNTTLTGIEVKKGDGTPVTYNVTNANGNNITLEVNKNFYVTIEKSAGENITITAKGKDIITTKKMWIASHKYSYDEITGEATIGEIIDDNSEAEQPLVEIERTSEDRNDSISTTLLFDLALRKRIKEINGATTIFAETGLPADRTITIDASGLSAGTAETATYKHRKDPVVVENGDIVTYELTIYNEGKIDGYASKIVDQLPANLVSTLGTTVISTKGNVYNVAYDETNNKITLTLTGTATSIPAYNGGTTVSSDTILVTCRVNQTAATDGATKRYLTNIAYIAEACDAAGTNIARDRNNTESQPAVAPDETSAELNNTDANSYKGDSSNPSVYNDTNNQQYYKGEEDDDDFEKLVVLPQKFDLALRKFITKVNSQNITDREPNLGAEPNWKYDNGTTLQKEHKKDKVRVKVGDTVVYTIRVYNEGDIAGYASKVTDYLPAGLSLKEFTAGDGSINDTFGWTPDVANTQKIVTTELSTKLIPAYNKTTNTASYEDLKVECVVNANATAENLKNIAEITEDTDENGNIITDIDSQPNNVNTNDYNPTNPTDGRGEQDDDDFEDLKLAELDLALRKFISKINNVPSFDGVANVSPSREPQVNTTNLKAGTADTAIYNHSKEPIQVNVGDYVLYTIRVYNEGDIDGYASQIIDYLPTYLDFVTGPEADTINSIWDYDSTTRKLTTKMAAANATTKLNAFDSEHDNGNGSGLSYVDVQVICKVNDNAPAQRKLTNMAEISEYKDEDGNVIDKQVGDRDSKPENFPDNLKDQETRPNYAGGNDTDTTDNYVPGQEDDDDFEKVIIRERKPDLALTKFITAVSADDKIEDGEYLTPNKNIGSKTNEYIRATVADTTGLKAGTSTNATYTPKKDIEPLVVGKNSYVLYNIRVYNEGEVDLFAGEITDYLPENLEFVNGEFNTGYGWTANGQTVKTTYLSSKNGEDKKLKAFDKEIDDGKGSGLDYKDLPILCKVSDKAESGKKLVNTAEITKYEDENGNDLPKDIDSEPENKEDKNVENRSQDDDDYEVVLIKEFDLALRKFITDIEGKEVTTRVPKLSYENGKITYTHPKDVLKVAVGDTVTYTLRVFNEGDIAGFAEEITDDIPKYLEFIPSNSTNMEYRWVMYDKDGKSTTKVKEAEKIVTDYTSKAYGETLMKKNNLTENPNLLNAFDKTAGISDKNPDYVDVKVAFKVKDPKSNEYVIVNKAQISEDADENGNPVDDIDSIPDKWNEGEDDQDFENVSVEYFDLSLLKYVTKTIVTENGKTKTTKTGNTGAKTDITPKVEIYRKRVNSTIVKFEYTIKVTNEGDIAGYAKEITDYVPKGLKFYSSDNKGWKDEGNNVISTTLLKDTLLKPGQSATVKVILRWVNGENNLGIKTNVAEISKDENEKGIPDRDSTPDNKKKGEDDIDDAPVLLTISTGMLENPVAIVSGALIILSVLGLGLVLIKKYVL